MFTTPPHRTLNGWPMKRATALIGNPIIWLAVTLSAHTEAAQAIRPPTLNYYFANDIRGALRAPTMEQLIATINAQYDKDFQQCISRPTYTCSKSVIIDSVGDDLFGWSNGLHNQYSLKTKFVYQNKNMSGNIYSHEAPSRGGVGASIEWKCPLAMACAPRVTALKA